MNLVDRAIAAVAPVAAVRRMAARQMLQVLNTGYSESGASVTKKSMKGWRPWSSSPQSDIDFNLEMLRNRSRDLFMGETIARSAINTQRTNVVGAGLRLKSRIDYEFLGLSRQQAEAWERQVEREFELWAESKFCDALRLNNFYELQSVLLISTLLNGDGWAVLKQGESTPYFPYSLRLHLIEADRISTPTQSGYLSYSSIRGKNQDTGNDIISGVEIDKNGGVVAYWISNKYRDDPTKTSETIEWTRVTAFGEKTGRPNVLQVMEAERCEQYRGVPYFSPIMESLKQMGRYANAEVTSAIITAYLSVFIKESAVSIGDFPLAETYGKEDKVDLDPKDFELGPGTINVLPPGYDVTTLDPNRPSSSFEAFVRTMAMQIGAALEIPYEVLMKSFQSSYSASRAALLEAWKAFRMRRKWFADDFCQPVYEMWLAEAVARGRIKAPGFFNDPLIAKAWSRAEWHGPAPGMLDPVKEVTAAEMRVKNGFSTRERETIEINGGDFDRNAEQLRRENELMAEILAPLEPAPQAQGQGRGE